MRRWYIGLKWMIWGMVVGELVSDCLIVKNQYRYNSFTFYFPRDEFRLISKFTFFNASIGLLSIVKVLLTSMHSNNLLMS